MAEKNNATCSICGKDYYVCLSCRDSIQLSPFKKFTDTSEHYKIFQVLRGYNTGVYNKDEAKEKFKNIDLHDLEDLKPSIKTTIKDILKEPVVEIIEEKVESTVKVEEEVPVVKKTTVSRKKNYKIEEVE